MLDRNKTEAKCEVGVQCRKTPQDKLHQRRQEEFALKERTAATAERKH